MNEVRFCPGWDKKRSADDPKPHHEACAQKYNERVQVLNGTEEMCPKCARRKKKWDDETFANAQRAEQERRDREDRVAQFVARLREDDPAIGSRDPADQVAAIEKVRVARMSTYQNSWDEPSMEQRWHILRSLAGLPYIEPEKKGYYGNNMTREEIAAEKARLEAKEVKDDEALTG